MSVGPASAWPDHAKATRLPSGDNAGDPSTPGYDTKGTSWGGSPADLRKGWKTSAMAITAAAAITAPTASPLRSGPLIAARCDSEAATGAVCKGETAYAWKTGT